MPVMDGYTAIRKIREQEIDVPIITLTASLPAKVEADLNAIVTSVITLGAPLKLLCF